MSKYYNWHDLDLAFQLLQREGKWPEYIGRIKVFGDEAVITVTNSKVMENQEEVWQKMNEWFPERFDRENHAFILESFSDESRTIQIDIEYEESVRSKRPLPLFGSLYNPQDAEYPEMFPTGPKIFAFHSYKGGVGRTLSALSFCRSLSKHKKDGKPHRLLIIDADYEAPGITWLARERGSFEDFSLFDALALVHEEENWDAEVLEFIASKIQGERLRIPAEKALVEHFFLPAYRKEEQLLAIPVMPKHMVQFIGREWIIGEFLHKLGAKLGVDAVVVDLRAGVSEFSAPLLFDPRVQKVLVTTTSTQAVQGTGVILGEIMKRMPDKREYPLPLIFTSMVTKDAKGKMDDIEAVYRNLLEGNREGHQGTEFMFSKTGLIHRLEFDQKLVHLEDLEHIAEKLNGTDLETVIDRVVEEHFVDLDKGEGVSLEKRNAVLENMLELCTALNEQKFDQDLPFLKSTPVRNLVQKFSAKLPAAIVMGGVGTGKTFNFLQIVKRQEWLEYVKSVIELRGNETNALIIPLLVSQRLSDDNQQIVQECLVTNRAELGADTNFDLTFTRQRIQVLLAKADVSELDWRYFWLEAIANAVGFTAKQEYSFGDINRFLGEKKRKVVFVMDGFGELFDDILDNSAQQQGVRVLCQEVVALVRDLPNTNIGLIAFVRKDLVQCSIRGNFDQFSKEHDSFEIKWNMEETLRLVVWIAQQAGYRDSLVDAGTEVELLQRDFLRKVVARFWGQKIEYPDGSGSITVNIFGFRFFDFIGNSEPVDIVCFLGKAAHLSQSFNTASDGRYLQSGAFIGAVNESAGKKLVRIQRELPIVRKIFEKIKNEAVDAIEPAIQLEKYQIRRLELQYLEMLGIVDSYEENYFLSPLYFSIFDMKWNAEIGKVHARIIEKLS